MTTNSIRGRILRRKLVAFVQIQKDAKERGESEVFLALCRFRIAEIEAALDREKREQA